MLTVEDIHTYYGDSYVLQGVSLRVPGGRAVAVLGRNGMGKTTLIRSIVGFTPPRRGRVVFKDRDITRWPVHEIARLGVGLVPQGRRIFPSLSVLENLIIAHRRRNGGGWTPERVFEAFPRLRERAHHKGNKLSGGEQQMLAIARALMTNPDLLLMDEPSEGLAPLLVLDLGNILQDLRRQGLSILLVEQNLPLALRLADYVYVLSKGRVVFEGTADALGAAEEVKRRYLGV
ncbi:MAG: ABC transporter ATP-binding protein [Armatimonadota bacterium]|nr:ABC transporter ATP-binding protein [Armatimonadota bacterium]